MLTSFFKLSVAGFGKLGYFSTATYIFTSYVVFVLLIFLNMAGHIKGPLLYCSGHRVNCNPCSGVEMFYVFKLRAPLCYPHRCCSATIFAKALTKPPSTSFHQLMLKTTSFRFLYGCSTSRRLAGIPLHR